MNEVDEKGQNFLQRCIVEGNLITCDLVCFLLGKGLIVDHQDNQGRTALLLAILEKQWNLVNLLVEKGADLQENYAYVYLFCKISSEEEKIVNLASLKI